MIEQAAADALVAAVRDVARQEIMPHFRNLTPDDVAAKTGPEDLVTVADRAAEAALAERIGAILPGAAIVGEEAVADDPSRLAPLGGSGTCVILDPVDGTANFARGIAVFGVILAVREAGETTFGLLYDPVMDDWVMARRGGGAWFCRPGSAPRRLRVRPDRPAEAQTLFMSHYLFPAHARDAIRALVPDFARVQTLRCSCHEYRALALGHADGLVSALSRPWDHLAGMLVVAEASGQGGRLDGRAHDAGDCDQVLICATGSRSVETLRRKLDAALAR